MQIDCLTPSHQMQQLVHFRELNDVHFLSRHIMSLSSHDHHSYLVIPLLQSIKVLEKKDFFSWPLSLSLPSSGEFSEWAHVFFSWIQLFQLVACILNPNVAKMSCRNKKSFKTIKKFILLAWLPKNGKYFLHFFRSEFRLIELYYIKSYRPKLGSSVTLKTMFSDIFGPRGLNTKMCMCAWTLIFFYNAGCG